MRSADKAAVNAALETALEEMELSTEACEACEYLKSWVERYPYGNGHATETICECSCPHWSKCLRIEQALEDARRG